jgi:hypothetical protein
MQISCSSSYPPRLIGLPIERPRGVHGGPDWNSCFEHLTMFEGNTPCSTSGFTATKGRSLPGAFENATLLTTLGGIPTRPLGVRRQLHFHANSLKHIRAETTQVQIFALLCWIGSAISWLPREAFLAHIPRNEHEKAGDPLPRLSSTQLQNQLSIDSAPDHAKHPYQSCPEHKQAGRLWRRPPTSCRKAKHTSHRVVTGSKTALNIGVVLDVQ